jgi:hypothetical protein
MIKASFPVGRALAKEMGAALLLVEARDIVSMAEEDEGGDVVVPDGGAPGPSRRGFSLPQHFQDFPDDCDDLGTHGPKRVKVKKPKKGTKRKVKEFTSRWKALHNKSMFLMPSLQKIIAWVVLQRDMDETKRDEGTEGTNWNILHS